MIKSVNCYPVSQLFDIEASVVYAIPRYQREYTWGKKEWEDMFDDIQENNPGYFLGSIICINQTTDAFSVQRLEVVDGQQRLTTLSLFFAALYQSLKGNELEDDTNDTKNENELEDDTNDIKAELTNLKRKLVLRKDKQLRLSPQIQNNNQNDYKAVLSEAGVIKTDEAPPPPHAGNRKIFRAYRYFQMRIKNMVTDENNRLPPIIAFLDKLSKACLVKIEVGSHADAYTLFESLNNRGKPLTAIDLIKNKLLAHLEQEDPGMIDSHFDVWNHLLGYLGDDYSIQERFFRHYYNAFKDQLNEPFRKDEDKNKKRDPLGLVATKSNLIQIYEKLINQDAKRHLQAIRSAAQMYALMLGQNPDKAWASLNKPLKDLDRIQGAPSYLLLLYLLMQHKELKIDVKEIGKIAQLLVKFFVRRNLTDTPPTRDLTRLFMKIIESIGKITGSAVRNAIQKCLIDISATDNDFLNQLSGSIYEENIGVARFILCALAEDGMTRENCVDLWEYEGKQFVWTIEHVFPQGEKIPAHWVEMIASGDKNKAREYQLSHVHKLGNLTITGFNSSLGNKGFLEKRDRIDSKKRHIGYKNGLNINKDLAKAESWSPKLIDQRTTKLAKSVLALFAMS